jgi:hypothetical protein
LITRACFGELDCGGARRPTVLASYDGPNDAIVTSQDFIKFWGKIFAFVLLKMIGNSQGFKIF